MHRITIAFVLTASCVLAQGVAPNGLRKGEWRRKDTPEGYQIVKVGRYQLQSNSEEHLVRRVGKHLNTMFKEVYTKFSPPTKTPRSGLVVKLFDDRKGFIDYGAPRSSAGYYSKVDKEMVGYNTGWVGGVRTKGGVTESGGGGAHRGPIDFRSKRWSMDTLGVFSHEGWHQYFHWSCGSWIPFPAWADEGIGDYFYTAYLDDHDDIVLGAPMDGRLGRIQAAIARDRHVPLVDFVRYDTRTYYSGDRGQNYAQGWALIHFFMEHPDYRKKKFPQRFVKVFKDVHNIEKAVKRVFPKQLDWEAMEKDWKAWIMAMPQPIYEDDTELARIEAEQANERAQKYWDGLPEHIREALAACLAKRTAGETRMKRATESPASDSGK